MRSLQTRSRPLDRAFAFTTRGARLLDDVAFAPNDWFVFGNETAGLSDAIRERFAQSQRIRLPMRPGNRSLNLSNAVAVVIFEAWRQATMQADDDVPLCQAKHHR